MRASDGERDTAADRLRSAAGEGRLTVDELDERLQLAYSATTHAELERIVADVPEVDARTAENVTVAGGEGASWVVAVMSGAERKGRWKVAARCKVLSLMGGVDLDFNGAEFSTGEVELRAVAIMGGIEIRVPEGLNVEVSDLNLMGGTTTELGDASPTPGGPVLRIKVLTLMGGAEIVRGRKRSRREERKLRQRHHHHLH